MRERREPEWLRDLRLRAFDAYQSLPLVEHATGNWRHATLTGLNLTDASLNVLSPTASTDAFAGEETRAGALVIQDGAVQRHWLSPDADKQGVRLASLADALGDPVLAGRLRPHLEALLHTPEEKLVALNAAFFNAGAVLYVPRGVVVEQPFALRYAYTQPHMLALPLTLVVLEEGAQAALLEVQEGTGADDTAPVASSRLEMRLAGDASLRYAQVLLWPSTTWAFCLQQAALASDARLRLLDVPLTGGRTRETIQVILEGDGSQADLLGVVAGEGKEHVDFQTLQEHRGSATRSDLVIHNALDGASSANFTGLIRIDRTARGTESSQQQKNILLSPKAQANSDPRLEILNNDVVRCTHGASVGPVDPELVFYLETRGLDRQTAEDLIVDGFFRTVVERLAQPDLQSEIWAVVQGKRRPSGQKAA